jgi:hypothetical protein
MTGPTLLDYIRDYLVAEGIVRKPDVAGELPPLWREPQDGAPAPGERDGVYNDDSAVLSIFDTGGIARAAYSPWRYRTVDFWLRLAKPPLFEQLSAEVTDAFCGDQAAKFGWSMAGLDVIESREWRPWGRLGSDENGWTYVAAFAFQVYAD